MSACSQIRVDGLDVSFLDAACALVLQEYDEQRRLMPYLPNAADYRLEIGQSMERLFRLGTGLLALQSHRVVGFLAGYPVDGLFGDCRGVYSPLYGHSTVPENRRQIYDILYEKAAELWVQSRLFSHALTLFAYDTAATADWFWRGFGMRCVDAVRPSASLVQAQPNLAMRKMTKATVPEIADLHSQHNLYYRGAPIFMPNIWEDPVTDLQEWLDGSNHHLWAAYQGGHPVGYIRIEPDGESFISLHPSVMNITAAFVLPRLRGSGVGTLLWSTAAEWSQQEGYRLLGVDYEAINPAARRFWGRHFDPYTCSVTRRVDERIAERDGGSR